MKWLLREHVARWLTYTVMVEADDFKDALDKWSSGQCTEFGAPEIGEVIDTPTTGYQEIFVIENIDDIIFDELVEQFDCADMSGGAA